MDFDTMEFEMYERNPVHKSSLRFTFTLRIKELALEIKGCELHRRGSGDFYTVLPAPVCITDLGIAQRFDFCMLCAWLEYEENKNRFPMDEPIRSEIRYNLEPK